MLKFSRRVFDSLVWNRRDEIPFIVFFSFLVTFLLARLTVRLVYQQVLPGSLFLNVKGVHVHHYNYGFFLLAVSGLWSLLDTKRRRLDIAALIYGIGLGLAVDEFGMFLRLRDDYYTRISYDAVVVVGALLLSIAYFPKFWRVLGKQVKSLLT